MADYADNSKAHFNYEILETLEAGLVLRGFEVKAVKTGKASIKGSYVKMINGRPELIGANIAPYQVGNTPEDYDPQRTRAVLLSKKQINTLIGLSQSQGLSLVPLKLYGTRNKVKLLIGIARGKKKYDKRSTLKKKDLARSRQRGIEE